MKFIAKEGQVIIAGRVGLIERKTDSLTAIRIAHRKNKEETEWLSVALCNPQGDRTGQKLADLAEKYVTKGAYVTVIANAVEGEKYTNYYAVSIELGPKPNAADKPVQAPAKEEEPKGFTMAEDDDDLPF